MTETPVSLRVANRLQALAQKGVDNLSAELVAISAPPALRAVVLEEMARIALKEAARFASKRRAHEPRR